MSWLLGAGARNFGCLIPGWRATCARWKRSGSKAPEALAGMAASEGGRPSGSATPYWHRKARGLPVGRRPPFWSRPSFLLYRILQGRLTASSSAARRLGHRPTHYRVSRPARHAYVFARQPGQLQRVVGRRAAKDGARGIAGRKVGPHDRSQVVSSRGSRARSSSLTPHALRSRFLGVLNLRFRAMARALSSDL